MPHVVEKEARDGERLQVLEAAGLLHLAVELGVLLLERPGDPGREAAGAVLQVADDLHVLDALRVGLPHAEHHRRRRAHAEAVRGLVHVHPLLGRRLGQRPDALAHRVLEDLGAAAGDRLEAGVAQPRDDVAHRPLRHLLEEVDLGRRERVEVDRREGGPDVAEHLLVEGERQVPRGPRPAAGRPCRRGRSSPGSSRRSARATGRRPRDAPPRAGRRRRTGTGRRRRSCS